jgi:peptide/nickel transport system ATP-binding protein
VSLSPLLEVKDLRVAFEGDRGRLTHAVSGTSFALQRGRTLGIVGESGCGKSVTALAIMRLLTAPGTRISGSIRFEGRELRELPERQMRDLRGNRLAMIFQEPMTSLNPSFTVGDQVAEALVRHRGLAAPAAQRAAIEMLARVKIPSPAVRADEYPHKLSGGMRQRVMIAMALACSPALLIADEPTTALDVTIQAQILDLIRNLREESGAAIILITHDLGIVAEVAERVMVMYAGRKVEEAPVRELYRSPRHPYTQGLFGAVPKLGSSLSGEVSKLAEIPGVVPNLKQRIDGCVFASRCASATDLCRQIAPALETKAPGHIAACHYAPKEAMAA